MTPTPMQVTDQKPPCVFVIAEVGSVHDGSLGNAVKLIELAKRCGAVVVEVVREQRHPSFVQFDLFRQSFESGRSIVRSDCAGLSH